MSKFRDYLMIDSGKMCPKCHNENMEVVNDNVAQRQFYRCKDCGCKLVSQGMGHSLIINLLALTVSQLFLYFVLLPNKVNSTLSIIIVIVILIISREFISFLAFALFGKTKLRIMK